MFKLLKVNGKYMLVDNKLACYSNEYEYNQVRDSIYLYRAPYIKNGSEVTII